MNHYIPIIRKLKGFILPGIIFVLVFPARAQYTMYQKSMEFTASILGISPTFYKGISYEKGEYDFNAIPVYLENIPIGNVAFRLNPYLNLAVRNGTSTAVKNFGVGFALPIYPYRSDTEKRFSHHFYIAPAIDVLLKPNAINADVDLNLFLEPGYSFRISDIIGINIGVSLGKTLTIQSEYAKLSAYKAFRFSCYWLVY
jgi:hypothetical protein